MSRLPQGSDSALDPVRAALHRTTQTQARQVEDAARSEAEAILHQARRQAAEISSTAEREGAEAARAEAAGRSARVRRQARGLVLARQEALRSELRRQVLDQVRELRRDPRYPRILVRLTARADKVLGPMASVTESAKGGVTAVAGSRRLDLSLPTLADQAIEDHAGEVRRLWEDA